MGGLPGQALINVIGVVLGRPSRNPSRRENALTFFDVIVTVDQNIPEQQPLVPAALDALASITSGQAATIRGYLTAS